MHVIDLLALVYYITSIIVLTILFRLEAALVVYDFFNTLPLLSNKSSILSSKI